MAKTSASLIDGPVRDLLVSTALDAARAGHPDVIVLRTSGTDGDVHDLDQLQRQSALLALLSRAAERPESITSLRDPVIIQVEADVDGVTYDGDGDLDPSSAQMTLHGQVQADSMPGGAGMLVIEVDRINGAGRQDPARMDLAGTEFSRSFVAEIARLQASIGGLPDRASIMVVL